MFSRVRIFGILVCICSLVIVLMAIFKYDNAKLAGQGGADRQIEKLQDEISSLRNEVRDKEAELKVVSEAQFVVFIEVASPEEIQKAQEMIAPFGWPIELVFNVDGGRWVADAMLNAMAQSGCGVVFTGNPMDPVAQSQVKTLLPRMEKAGVRNDNFWLLRPEQNVEEAKQALAEAGYKGCSYVTDYEARIMQGKEESGLYHFEYVPLYQGQNRSVGTLPLAVDAGSTSAFYLSNEVWSKEAQEAGEEQIVIGKLESIQEYVAEQSVFMKSLPEALATWDARDAEKAQKEEEVKAFREEKKSRIEEIQKELNEIYGEREARKEK